MSDHFLLMVPSTLGRLQRQKRRYVPISEADVAPDNTGWAIFGLLVVCGTFGWSLVALGQYVITLL
jgi:hypothetical protein